MSNTLSTMTAKELAEMPDDGNRYELVRGELKMMSPAGGRHGRIAMKLSRRIGNFVEEHNLGETFAAETGFLIQRDPDTVRSPDVAYVSHETLGEFADCAEYLPVIPDLVAEIISPNDHSSAVEEKATAWAEAGVSCVLVVDPQTKSIRQYRLGKDIQCQNAGRLDLGHVLASFQLDIDELFS